jgi:hypothetical protein
MFVRSSLVVSGSNVFSHLEKDMKIVLGSIVIIAGLVIAAGGGLVGATSDESAEEKAGCCATSKAVAAQSAEGGCCASRSATTLTSAEASGGEACSKVCGTASGCETPCPVASKCEGACPVSGASEGTCPMAVAMEKLPKMTYAVASEKVCCAELAGKLAAEHNAPVHYVVADKEYPCKQAAMAALVDQTESFVAAFTSAKRCDASGTVFVAGTSTSCQAQAEQRATAVKTAVEKVKMCYSVDGEQATCSNDAEIKAKEKDVPVEYHVGDQKTTCHMTARLNLARAKYQAAVSAMNGEKSS